MAAADRQRMDVTNLLHLHGFVNSERLNCPADLLASQMSH